VRRDHPRLLTVVTLLLASCGGRTVASLPDGGVARDSSAREDGARSRTCDEVGWQYIDLADLLNFCGRDADCIYYTGACAVGPCFFPVNRAVWLTELQRVEAEWAAMRCFPSSCGKCPSPPPLQCVGGRCAADARECDERCAPVYDGCSCQYRCGTQHDDPQCPSANCPANIHPVDPLCDCGAKGCSMRPCTEDSDCGSGPCVVFPGSGGKRMCTFVGG
jgi:hypothetical protein